MDESSMKDEYVRCLAKVNELTKEIALLHEYLKELYALDLYLEWKEDRDG